MGNFYTNITLRGPDQEEVAEFLREEGRTAYVSPPMGGYVVVFDEKCDTQDDQELSSLASALSARFSCPALAVLDHDDSVLLVRLFEGGPMVDEYLSAPDAFDMDEEEAEEVAGDPEALCRAFGAEGREEKVRAILSDRKTYTFEYERHAALADALGLPRVAVSLGFDYISASKDPARIERAGLVLVP